MSAIPEGMEMNGYGLAELEEQASFFAEDDAEMFFGLELPEEDLDMGGSIFWEACRPRSLSTSTEESFATENDSPVSQPSEPPAGLEMPAFELNEVAPSSGSRRIQTPRRVMRNDCGRCVASFSQRPCAPSFAPPTEQAPISSSVGYKRSFNDLRPVQCVDVSDLTLDVLNGLQAIGLNRWGERDWEGTRQIIREMRAQPADGDECKLGKSFKNFAKNLLGERRRRKQLDTWKKLKSEPDMFAALRRLIFPDTSLFDDDFVRIVAEELETMRTKKFKALLDWTEPARNAVVNKIAALHLSKYGPMVNRLNQDHFAGLLSPSDVEMALILACGCQDCEVAFSVSQCEGRNTEAVRLHWTKQKASLLYSILKAHLFHGADMYRVCRLDPRFTEWSENDLNQVLRQVHQNRSNCQVCSENGPRQRRRSY